MTALYLALLVGIPLLGGILCLRLAEQQPDRALRASVVAALLMVLVDLLAVMDEEVFLIAGRSLELRSISQLGIQLLGLAMLGFILSQGGDSPREIAQWLPVGWFSVAGLNVSLLLTSLPLALLVFLASALIWAFGLAPGDRAATAGVVMRYTALLSLAMPLLLIAFRLAEGRTDRSESLEQIILALAVPAFGLILGMIPLHAWTLNLAGGAPRPMVFGVISLVQTTGFVLLLRTLAEYPWVTSVARDVLVAAGATSALIGGWLALSAKRSDPDDWLVYAAVANSGMILAGLGTQSKIAAAGVALLLFARVLALVVLDLAPRVDRNLRRLAYAAGTLVLAGTPGLAGFPGLWLILRRLQETWSGTGQLAGLVSSLAILLGSGLLFATAIRRWRAEDLVRDEAWYPQVDRGARRAVQSLILILIVLGLAPQIIASEFASALNDIFFRNP